MSSRDVSPEQQFFTEFKKDASVHGLLAGLAFMVILPTGILVARYLRTFTNRWYHAHWIINLALGFPLILAAGAMARNAHHVGQFGSLTPQYVHKMPKRGLFIIGLYIGQLVLGLFMRYIRIPFPAIGHKPPQNFLPAVQGLVIIGLANYQIYDGLYHKGSFLAHDVRQFAKHAWQALGIIFLALYAIGLTLLRRQYIQERRDRLLKEQESSELPVRSAH